jgi:hypothetical protein
MRDMFFFVLYSFLGVIGIIIYLIALISVILYYPIWKITQINKNAGIVYPRDLFLFF